MMIRPAARAVALLVPLVLTLGATACGGKKPPIARPVPPPAASPEPGLARRPPAPPEPVAEPTIVPPEPVREDNIAAGSLDDLNRSSMLKPIFFDYDSSDVAAAGQAILDANAAILKKYPTWTITIEGHCDERGTAEYNLVLANGARSPLARNLISLGFSADRLRTVSYGKEFPFDPGHEAGAYVKNRRAHFVITAK